MSFYDEYVTFEKSSGDQLYACCPLHSEKTPSFTVNEETGEWYCHGCGKGGTEVEFIEYFYDVPKKIAKKVFDFWKKKNELLFPTEEQICNWEEELSRSKLELDYLHKVGITDDTIKKYRLGYDDCRIMIPIKSRTGQWVNVRKYLPPYRRLDGVKNVKCLNMRYLGSNRFYPYDAFEEDDIYLVEGEKDCLSARSQGYNAVTGLGGSAIPVEEVGLFRGKNVYLMLDTDQVGERNVKNYINLLKPLANSIFIVSLPTKDYSELYETKGKVDLTEFTSTVEEVEKANEEVEAQEVSLVHSEFTENLNTWVNLNNMSVVGAEPRIYTVPIKLKAICRNVRCNKPCALANVNTQNELQIVNIDARQMLRFIDSADTAQDAYLHKVFGCKSVIAEPVDFVNIQKIIFQESASFIDGLDDASFENRYGIYMYTDYRLNATLKYNFKACRVTDPKSQQNYYVVKDAESIAALKPVCDESVMNYFKVRAKESHSALDLINSYYKEWQSILGIEGRADLFGALILTYCSVTEIEWSQNILKGWLDIMCIGDTRTGKSQMAQRFVKYLKMGSYINGENARRTGVIGGVQRFGDSWVVTWGAIPMNDKGLLIIDEASGLEIDDIKDLSSTRSSGAVTLNKIVKGEARARTRLIWLSNPRSGKNLEDFYWKGYGAFQEFIPVAEDQARYDLVLTAAREDIDVLEGVDESIKPDLEKWKSLFNFAWGIPAEDIIFCKEMKVKVREYSKALNEVYGGGPLIVGVAVYEKLLRLSCAFAILCGNLYEGKLYVELKHLAYADEFLRMCLDKGSLGYKDYIKEFKRSQQKKQENTKYIRSIITMYPALKVLLSSNSFKGYQFQEILGISKDDSSVILSELIKRGLLRPSAGANYVPDKMLMEIAKQMEV